MKATKNLLVLIAFSAGAVSVHCDNRSSQTKFY